VVGRSVLTESNEDDESIYG
jgi:hypothetical protein